MPDNLDIRQPADQEWIDIHQPYDLRDWAIYFSVSIDKLKAAVEAVGPAVEDVKRHLGK